MSAVLFWRGILCARSTLGADQGFTMKASLLVVFEAKARHDFEKGDSAR